mmetsp:Transcript_65234/g.164419  ORF Transcript_65234/g.164419 Transcript_65234/m.164419 type:complete len:203 (-) Transcript_65234:11-619(-)
MICWKAALGIAAIATTQAYVQSRPLCGIKQTGYVVRSIQHSLRCVCPARIRQHVLGYLLSIYSNEAETERCNQDLSISLAEDRICPELIFARRPAPWNAEPNVIARGHRYGGLRDLGRLAKLGPPLNAPPVPAWLQGQFRHGISAHDLPLSCKGTGAGPHPNLKAQHLHTVALSLSLWSECEANGSARRCREAPVWREPRSM